MSAPGFISGRTPAGARVALLLTVLLTGCNGGNDSSGPAADADTSSAPAPVHRSAERDGTRLEVTLDRDEAEAGERLALTIEVGAPAGIDVEMPAWNETLGPFEIVDAARPPDVPDGDARRWTHRYTLTSFAPGTYEIPEIIVRLADTPGNGDAVRLAEIAVEAIPVEIASALAGLEDAADLLAMRDAVAVPVERPPLWPWLLLLAAVYWAIALTAMLVIVVRAGRAARSILPPAPHEWALDALDRLVADDLPGRADFLGYYVRLSDIVRRYVEARFRISAPEQTTDEFLRAARDHDQLELEHRALLEGFLRAADMVKFARHEPGRAECDAAMSAARSFVEETTDRDAPLEVAA